MQRAGVGEWMRLALAEDLGSGDHTSLACIGADVTGSARLLIKESGVICGTETALQIFQSVDPSLEMNFYLGEGAAVSVGDVVFTLHGSLRSILAAERLVLNVMQRLSDIATVTRKFVDAVSHTSAKILDTRKTTPVLRALEKHAVIVGGGMNHRFGLFDMILIKDNHVDACGGVAEAIARALAYKRTLNRDLSIEVEVRHLNDLSVVLQLDGVDRVLLDNFSIENTGKAVALCAGKVPLESSGGIRLSNVSAYAECGVEFISVGALTHSPQALDMSLKVHS